MNNKKSNEKIYNISNYNSFFIAFIVFMNLIPYGIPKKLLFDNILIIITCITFLILVIKNDFSINRRVLFFSIFIFILFSITIIDNGNKSSTITYLLYFIAFGFTAMYSSSLEYNIEKIYKYLIYMYAIYIPPILMWNLNDHPKEEWMGVSYAILPILIVSFIYIVNYKENKLIYKLALINLIIYLYKFVPIASRGSIICIFMFLIIFFIIKSVKSTINKNILIMIISITIYIFYRYMYVILSIFNNIMIKFGYYIRFIEKNLDLISKNNLLNGRDIYYSLAIDGIKSSPLFGNGIGIYESRTGLIYVHNFFLQIFYEIGIVVAVPIILLLICGVYRCIISKKVKVDLAIFIWFMFSISFFRLLFSSVYWKEPKFWFVLGFCLTNISLKKYKWRNK